MTETAIDAAMSQAEIYDTLFVPALFRQWADVVIDTARISRGQRVLDVACGTGVLAGVARARSGDGGAVVGVDPSEEMLDVARARHAGVTWRNGRAESLPFDDRTFDAVVSQFGFMFFDDKPAALREAMRVLRPGGRLAVAVCDAIDHSPGYAVLAELLHRLFGEQVADSFRAPFSLGDRDELLSIARDAEIVDASVARHDGEVRFDSIAALVSTERACAWTLGGLLNEREFERLLAGAEESLRPFVAADGRIAFVMPVLILTAEKP